LEDTTTDDSSVADQLNPKVNFWLGFESDHIYGHRIMGNFNTSRLATLHGLLDDPLPSSRPIVGILEPAAKVEPHIMVAAS
jgi:hypothetical protein